MAEQAGCSKALSRRYKTKTHYSLNFFVGLHMVKYWVKTPRFLKMVFPAGLVWKMPLTPEPTVYITFDDGPHPVATPFIIQEFEKYGARGTFFCLGKNVLLYPDIYNQLIEKGHRVANHTHDHLNAYHTADDAYIENIKTAAQHIDSNLFRPPYGRIRRSQVKKLRQVYPTWKICMWDVLSGDFDTRITAQKCMENVLKNIEPGSIVLFHDSEKAWPRMSYALPKVLEHCRKKGWEMKALPY